MKSPSTKYEPSKSKSKLKLSEKQKSELFKKSVNIKIEIFRKIEPKIFEADELFSSNGFTGKPFHSQDKSSKKQHQSHSPVKQFKQRQSIELKVMSANNPQGVMNILKNNYLSVLLSTPMHL